MSNAASQLAVIQFSWRFFVLPHESLNDTFEVQEPGTTTKYLSQSCDRLVTCTHLLTCHHLWFEYSKWTNLLAMEYFYIVTLVFLHTISYTKIHWLSSGVSYMQWVKSHFRLFELKLKKKYNILWCYLQSCHSFSYNLHTYISRLTHRFNQAAF